MRIRIATAGQAPSIIELATARVTIGDTGKTDVALAGPSEPFGRYRGAQVIVHRYRELTIAEAGPSLPTEAVIRRNGRDLEGPVLVRPGDHFEIHRPRPTYLPPASDVAQWLQIDDAAFPSNAPTIAVDPATPPPLLLLLAPLCPDAFFANPATARWCDDDPGWVARLDGDRIEQILRASKTAPSVAFLRLASGHASNRVRLLVARHPTTPVDALPTLWAVAKHDTDRSHGHAIAHHPRTPPSILAEILDGDRHWITSVAGHPGLTRELAEAIVARDDRAAPTLAANPATPLDLMARLAEHAHSEVRAACAGHPAIPGELLSRLAGDPDERVREAAAAAPLSPASMEALACDSSPGVLYRLATNPAIGGSVVAALAASRNHSVAVALAGNPRTPPEVLAQLGDPYDESIAYELARNPRTPTDRLIALAACAGAGVRLDLIANLYRPALGAWSCPTLAS